MGYAKELSWSFTRSKSIAECPRGAWFQYYVSGEKDVAARAYALRDLTTLKMAAGSAVDLIISAALKAFRDDGEVKVGLADFGIRHLRKQLANSLQVVPEIQTGGRWDRSSNKWMPPFVHHYYGLDLGDEAVRRMEDRIATCLSEFERGEVWERIRSVPPASWHPLNKVDENGGDRIPSFYSSIGLKIWSSIDFAMLDDGTVYVIDWKSGVPSRAARESAREQLAVYVMWACKHYGVRPEQVRVQAVWLSEGATWAPETVEEAALRSLAKRIKEEATAEEERLQIQRNIHGKPIQINGPRENFLPNPSTKRCVECRFREICSEGLRECSHLRVTEGLTSN